MEKAKYGHLPLKIYKSKLTLTQMVGIPLIIIAVMGIYSIVVPTKDFTLFLVVATCGIAGYSLLAAWFVRGASQYSMLIYEAGIEFRVQQNSVFAQWKNLSHFEVKKMGKTKIVYLKSRSSLQKRIVNIKVSMDAYQFEFPILGSINIPTKRTSLFKHDVDFDRLKKTEFGQLIFQYAPHLFEKEK